MKTVAPDYYPHFRCLAGQCRHSCCIGWEIEIDPATRALYRTVSGPFGKRLEDAICDENNLSSFRLDARERCPFLNENGLCDLITTLGEDMLCQICADHPRFRSFFSDRTEIGLGLCCEGAAALILTQQKPVDFIVLAEDGPDEPLSHEEEALLRTRAALLHLLQNRSLPLDARLQQILSFMSFSFPHLPWPRLYQSLERLDNAWGIALSVLPETFSPKALPGLYNNSHAPFTIALEQFCAYLLFRHLPGALEDGLLSARVAFCVLSTYLLAALHAIAPPPTLPGLCELARMYSAEIEYSDENIAILLDALTP